MKIEVTADAKVRHVIEALGRTEDVRFSPSNKRLAITSFWLNAVVVFDIDIAGAAGAKNVALKRVAKFSSPCLSYPHGVDFIDEDTIVVANRGGDIPVFKLPAELDGDAQDLSPVQMLRSAELNYLKASGSVTAIKADEDRCELLICNSGARNVSRHLMDNRPGGSAAQSDILLEKWIDVPDGLSISGDRQWIAVSNHNTHNVMLYRNSELLNRNADPDGILRSVVYPHGLRFSADGKWIFVADAGAPFIHVYANEGEGWQGVRSPAASIRNMDDEIYLRGRSNPKEGGPKGVDIDAGMSVMATTCECQPLAFFDLRAILAKASAGLRSRRACAGAEEQDATDVRLELDVMAELDDLSERANRAEAKAAAADKRAARAEARAEKARARAERAKAKAARIRAKAGFTINGRSWPITAPLRRLYSALRRSN